MTGIPRSVMEEAFKLHIHLIYGSVRNTPSDDVRYIAEALIARDKRAAEIVRARAPATQDMTSTFICDALDDAADAIERYDTPTGQEESHDYRI